MFIPFLPSICKETGLVGESGAILPACLASRRRFTPQASARVIEFDGVSRFVCRFGF